LPQYQPQYVDPSFEQSPTPGLRLLPVVDGRKGTQAPLDLDREVRERFAGLIRDRGYKVELASWPHAGPLPPLPHDTQSFAMTQYALIPYLPPGNTPVVIIVVGDTSEKNIFISKEGLATVSAWVFEPATGKLLWMDRSVSNSLWAGLDPILTPASQLIWNASLDALHECLDDLNSTLPIPKK
jgi:hypothetical protein